MTIPLVSFQRYGTTICRRVSFIPRVGDTVYIWRKESDTGFGSEQLDGTVAKVVIAYQSAKDDGLNVAVELV